MVLLHTAVLAGAGVEVVLLRRPFIPALAAAMFAVFLAANAVRWWVIRTLGEHWNVQVMDSTRLGVVTSGPFRYVRHPNYAAVFTEMLVLPLIHTAWITSAAGAIAHVAVLAQRLSTEERVLFANPDYRAAHDGKAALLAGSLLKRRIRMRWRIHSAVCVLFSRRLPAPRVRTKTATARRSRRCRNSLRDFTCFTLRTSRKRERNLTIGNRNIRKNLSAKWPLHQLSLRGTFPSGRALQRFLLE